MAEATLEERVATLEQYLLKKSGEWVIASSRKHPS